MPFIKSLNITKGSFTVRCSKVDHGLRDMKTLPLCNFFPPQWQLLSLCGSATGTRWVLNDGCPFVWSKNVEWKGGQKRTPVCDLPGDFTKLTSYRVVSIEANVFVSGSHGVIAILEEPGFQLVVLCGEVVLVDSVYLCVSVCVCAFCWCAHAGVVKVIKHVYIFVFV